MKLPAWVAVFLMVLLLSTGKAGRGRTGPIVRVGDDAHIAAADYVGPEPDHKPRVS